MAILSLASGYKVTREWLYSHSGVAIQSLASDYRVNREWLNRYSGVAIGSLASGCKVTRSQMLVWGVFKTVGVK